VVDFIDEFYHSWLMRVWGLTVSILSVAPSLIPELKTNEKLILGALIFSGGILVSLILFIFVPRKYIAGFFPEVEDLAEIHATAANEAVAKQANALARAHFGKKMGFSYRKYRRWRRKNPFVFVAFTDKKGRLVGFVDVFPLTPAAGHALIQGEIKEGELSVDDIFDSEHRDKSNHIHVASVVCYSRSTLASSVVLAAALRYIRALYPPRPNRTYLAVGGTKDGCRVLERFGFTQVAPESAANPQRSVYYLRSESVEANSRALRDFDSLIRVRLTVSPAPT
jgi:hypothetical protein